MINHMLYDDEARRPQFIASEPSKTMLSLDGCLMNEGLPRILAKIEKSVYELSHQCTYGRADHEVSVAMFRRINNLRDEIELLQKLIASSFVLKLSNLSK